VTERRKVTDATAMDDSGIGTASGIITSPACPLSTSRGRGRSGSHTHIIGINRQGRPPQES